MSVSLKEAYLGGERNISVSRRSICRKCQATGAKNGEMKICPHCHGEGMSIKTIRTGMGIMRMQSQCEHCNGKGKYPKSKCPVCHGHKTVSDTKNFKVNVEKGVFDGHEIVFKGEGDSVPSALPGDVVFSVHVKKNKNFVRKGDDLHTKLKIEFKDALMGFNETIKHLDDRLVNLSKNGVSQPHEILKIQDEGMPKKDNPNEKGDLFVEIVFNLPKRINIKQKKLIREIYK